MGRVVKICLRAALTPIYESSKYYDRFVKLMPSQQVEDWVGPEMLAQYREAHTSTSTERHMGGSYSFSIFRIRTRMRHMCQRIGRIYPVDCLYLTAIGLSLLQHTVH